jgi:hypothetical protein
MMTLACSAVARAGLSSTTASLDESSADELMFVAGWLTTAVDLTHQATLIAQLGSSLDVLL